MTTSPEWYDGTEKTFLAAIDALYDRFLDAVNCAGGIAEYIEEDWCPWLSLPDDEGGGWKPEVSLMLDLAHRLSSGDLTYLALRVKELASEARDKPTS